MSDLLVRKGAKIDGNNLYGITNLETFKLALEHGGEIGMVSDDGRTALMRNYQLDFVKFLVKEGIDVNQADHEGCSALLNAASAGRYDIVSFLIENGANVNQVDTYGYNALLFAAGRGSNDIVKLLIEKGSDLSIVNIGRENIFSFYPPDGNNREMFEFLMKHGADYSLLPKATADNQLQQMANNTQSAHNAKTITQVYSKFMTDETKISLNENKEQYNKQFRKLLSDTLLPEQGPMSPEFQKLFLKLVKDKIQDCEANIGQGDQFIEQLLIATSSNITLDDIKNKKVNPEEKSKLIENVSSFIASNSEASKKYLKNLSEKVTNLTADLNGNHQVGNITIDQSLVIPLILSKVEDKAELPRLVIEAIDAATMYASGGASCKDGQLNKLSELLIGVDDQQMIDKQVIKGEFPFKGFKVNHNALVEEIFKITGDKSKGLNEIDAQKVRSAIYQIMKEGNLESGRFSEIFSYGSENNVLAAENKMKEFKREINYEIISKIQQEILGAKSQAVYNIPDQYLPVAKYKNFEEPIIPKVGQTSLLKQNIQRKLYDLNYGLNDLYGNLFYNNKGILKDEDLNGLNNLEGRKLAEGVVELLLSKNVDCVKQLEVEKEYKTYIGNSMTVDHEKMLKFIVDTSIDRPAMDKIKEVFKNNKEKRSNSNDPRIKPRMVEDILNPPERKASENNLYRGKLGLTR